MQTSNVERLLAWSQLRHRIIALQLEADLPKLADDSKHELTYVPVCLGGPGPSDGFWPEQRRTVALCEEGLRLDEFILQESARCTRSPTKEEREAQQERELPFLRKLIDLTYEAYRKDWVGQGMKISPAFLWAVRQKVFAAVTLYLMEDEKLTKELLNTSCLHLPVGFAPAHLARLLRRLPMSSLSHRRFQATDYINNLVKRIRVEALKLESVGPSLKKEWTAAEQEQARGSPQPGDAGEAQTLVVGQGNTRKPHNVHHDPLKALIGTTKRDHPGISHRDLCRGLDVKRAELPRGSTWQKKSGERSWIGNCNCDAVRPLMDTYFSKIPPASPERKHTK